MTPMQGQVLAGRYRLVRVLGRGGMSTVWLARDDMLGREVAVKEVVPPPDLPEPERQRVRERTLREARAAARLSNPFAVTVYDVIEADNRPWIIMQRIDAPSLADLLRDEGPLTPRRAAHIGLCVLDALSAAHDAGVLHRDVKPANILLTEYGRAVLTDFGIATVEGDPALTTTGVVVGSPAYLAPERARGEPPTAASDLFSLGATLYAAVEGTSPFQRDSQLATLNAITSEDAPAASHGGALAPVIEQLLAKDPHLRPSAGETRILLQQAALAEHAAEMAAPTVVQRPRQPPGDAPTAPQSHPATAPPVHRGRRWIPVALVAALLLGLAAGGLYLLTRPQPVESRATAPAGKAAATSEPATASPDRHPPSPSPTGGAPATTGPGGAPAATGPGGVTTGSGAGTGSGSDARADSGSDASQRRAPPAIPAGFRLHTDPTGFRVAVPDGWTRSTTDTRTFFREPGGRRYLMVDQTTQPKADALADWQRQEASVSQRLSGYQRVRLERVAYRGWNAADWEFSWRPGDSRLHVLNRNIRVSDRRAYALYWSTPEQQWADSRGHFDTFARTFEPAR